MFVEGIYKNEEGQIRLSGRAFSHVYPAFDKPYDSRDIGVFKCVASEVGHPIGKLLTWDFSKVTGKFFIFPMNKNLDEPSVSRSEVPALDEWIVVRLRHTDEGMKV